MRIPDPAHVAAMAARLRAFLLAEFAHEDAGAVGAALMYETASLVAAVSERERDADRLLAQLARQAIAQIHALGVGRPHP